MRLCAPRFCAPGHPAPIRLHVVQSRASFPFLLPFFPRTSPRLLFHSLPLSLSYISFSSTSFGSSLVDFARLRALAARFSGVVVGYCCRLSGGGGICSDGEKRMGRTMDRGSMEKDGRRKIMHSCRSPPSRNLVKRLEATLALRPLSRLCPTFSAFGTSRDFREGSWLAILQSLFLSLSSAKGARRVFI